MTQNTKAVDFASYVGLNVKDAWFAIAGEYFANNLKNDNSMDIVSLYEHFALSRGVGLHDMEMTVTYEGTADVKETFEIMFNNSIRFNSFPHQPVFFKAPSSQDLPIIMDMVGMAPRAALPTEREVFKNHADYAGEVGVVKFRILASNHARVTDIMNMFSIHLRNSGIHLEFSRLSFNLI